MPKKSFVVNRLTEAESKTLSHLAIVARDRRLLTKVMKFVKDSEHSERRNGCHISTRAVRDSHNNNKYPVVTCRVKFSDSPAKGQGKKLTLACHAVAMLAKLRKKSHDCPLWDASMQVSHTCHNTCCFRRSHLVLESPEMNTSRNIQCFGQMCCLRCDVSLAVCNHEPKCQGVRKDVCSKCVKM